MNGLRVLITNITLAHRTGTEINVRELIMLGAPRGGGGGDSDGEGASPRPSRAAAAQKAKAPGGGDDFEDFPGALEDEVSSPQPKTIRQYATNSTLKPRMIPNVGDRTNYFTMNLTQAPFDDDEEQPQEDRAVQRRDANRLDGGEPRLDQQLDLPLIAK